MWNYHAAVESGQVDYRSQISCLLGHQEQRTVESQGRHVGDPLVGFLHQQGIDGLLKILTAVPGPETDALMGELRPLLECNAHPVLDDAGGPAVAQQTPPVRGKVCQASPRLGPINVVWLRLTKKPCQTSCFPGRVVDGPFRRQLERAAPVSQSSEAWRLGNPGGQRLKV